MPGMRDGFAEDGRWDAGVSEDDTGDSKGMGRRLKLDV